MQKYQQGIESLRTSPKNVSKKLSCISGSPPISRFSTYLNLMSFFNSNFNLTLPQLSISLSASQCSPDLLYSHERQPGRLWSLLTYFIFLFSIRVNLFLPGQLPSTMSFKLLRGLKRNSASSQTQSDTASPDPIGENTAWFLPGNRIQDYPFQFLGLEPAEVRQTSWE